MTSWASGRPLLRSDRDWLRSGLERGCASHEFAWRGTSCRIERPCLGWEYNPRLEPKRNFMNRLDADHWTYVDYLQLPDDGTRCEILEGERVMTPAPFTPHQRVSENLGFHLAAFVRQTKAGIIFRAPCDVILAEDCVVQPDLLFVPAARASIIKKGECSGLRT